MNITYTVTIDREEDGRVIANVPGIPGCHAYDKTPSAAARRVKSALRFYLAEMARLGTDRAGNPTPFPGSAEGGS